MTDATTKNNLALLNRGTLTFIEWWRTTKRIGQLFTLMKPGAMLMMVRIVIGWRGMMWLAELLVVWKGLMGTVAQLIILGAGDEICWIPNTTLIFRSNKILVIIMMSADHFEEWFATKLFPYVPPNSLIVMDNTSYHGRRSDPVPVKSYTDQNMQDWLQAKGGEFPTNVLKAELYSMIQRLKPTPCYVVGCCCR